MKSRRYPDRATRRDVLQIGMGAALAGALFPTRVLPAEAMLARPIPSSGEALPVIGLGTSRVFDVGDDEAGRSACRAVLEALRAGGATLVDSSPMYRSAEEVAGDLAAELQLTDQLFWATKVWADGAAAGIEQMEDSMRLFDTQQIDLMQVHNLRDWQTHMPVLRDWKAEGRIRYIGITHFRAAAFDDLERVINATELDFVQLNYSIAEREAEERLLPLCADKGIATLINRPFARGALFAAVEGRQVPQWAAEFGAVSWGQFFLKFILSHPAATCLIPATRKARHMVDNVGAGFGPLPDQEQRRKMITFMQSL
ncbi:MAG: aldo/keto reductase [Gammaproteobacteria bacterium]|nr:aldo/keto reductase [Gammaproteobacteria bacterium]